MPIDGQDGIDHPDDGDEEVQRQLREQQHRAQEEHEAQRLLREQQHRAQEELRVQQAEQERQTKLEEQRRQQQEQQEAERRREAEERLKDRRDALALATNAGDSAVTRRRHQRTMSENENLGPTTAQVSNEFLAVTQELRLALQREREHSAITTRMRGLESRLNRAEHERQGYGMGAVSPSIVEGATTAGNPDLSRRPLHGTTPTPFVEPEIDNPDEIAERATRRLVVPPLQPFYGNRQKDGGGDQPFSSWIKSFEQEMEIARIERTAWLKTLRLFLRDAAVTVYDSRLNCLPYERRTYQGMVEVLRHTYDTCVMEREAQRGLCNLHWDPKACTIDEFYAKVEKIAASAYPEFDDNARQRLVIRQFIEAMPPRTQRQIDVRIDLSPVPRAVQSFQVLDWARDITRQEDKYTESTRAYRSATGGGGKGPNNSAERPTAQREFSNQQGDSQRNGGSDRGRGWRGGRNWRGRNRGGGGRGRGGFQSNSNWNNATSTNGNWTDGAHLTEPAPTNAFDNGGGRGRGQPQRGQPPRGGQPRGGGQQPRGGGRNFRDVSEINCFNCNQKGHYARDCNQAPVINTKLIKETVMTIRATGRTAERRSSQENNRPMMVEGAMEAQKTPTHTGKTVLDGEQKRKKRKRKKKPSPPSEHTTLVPQEQSSSKMQQPAPTEHEPAAIMEKTPTPTEQRSAQMVAQMGEYRCSHQATQGKPSGVIGEWNREGGEVHPTSESTERRPTADDSAPTEREPTSGVKVKQPAPTEHEPAAIGEWNREGGEVHPTSESTERRPTADDSAPTEREPTSGVKVKQPAPTEHEPAAIGEWNREGGEVHPTSESTERRPTADDSAPTEREPTSGVKVKQPAPTEHEPAAIGEWNREGGEVHPTSESTERRPTADDSAPTEREPTSGVKVKQPAPTEHEPAAIGEWNREGGEVHPTSESTERRPTADDSAPTEREPTSGVKVKQPAPTEHEPAAIGEWNREGGEVHPTSESTERRPTADDSAPTEREPTSGVKVKQPAPTEHEPAAIGEWNREGGEVHPTSESTERRPTADDSAPTEREPTSGEAKQPAPTEHEPAAIGEWNREGGEVHPSSESIERRPTADDSAPTEREPTSGEAKQPAPTEHEPAAIGEWNREGGEVHPSSEPTEQQPTADDSTPIEQRSTSGESKQPAPTEHEPAVIGEWNREGGEVPIASGSIERQPTADDLTPTPAPTEHEPAAKMKKTPTPTEQRSAQMTTPMGKYRSSHQATQGKPSAVIGEWNRGGGDVHQSSAPIERQPTTDRSAPKEQEPTSGELEKPTPTEHESAVKMIEAATPTAQVAAHVLVQRGKYRSSHQATQGNPSATNGGWVRHAPLPVDLNAAPKERQTPTPPEQKSAEMHADESNVLTTPSATDDGKIVHRVGEHGKRTRRNKRKNRSLRKTIDPTADERQQEVDGAPTTKPYTETRFMTIPVLLNGRKSSAQIDTGSPVSLVGRRPMLCLIAKYGRDIVRQMVEPLSKPYYDYSGNPIELKGTITLDLKLMGTRLKFNACIDATAHRDLILGMDVMARMGCALRLFTEGGQTDLVVSKPQQDGKSIVTLSGGGRDITGEMVLAEQKYLQRKTEHLDNLRAANRKMETEGKPSQTLVQQGKVVKVVTMEPRTREFIYCRLANVPRPGDDVSKAVFVEESEDSVVNEGIRIPAQLVEQTDGFVWLEIRNEDDTPREVRLDHLQVSIDMDYTLQPPGLEEEECTEWMMRVDDCGLTSLFADSEPRVAQLQPYDDQPLLDGLNYRSLGDRKAKVLSRAEIGDVSEDITEENRKEMMALLCRNHDVLALTDDELGCCTLPEHAHVINTGDAAPIHQPLRRLAMTKQLAVKKTLDTMRRTGVIQTSCSPWSSPIVPVWKRDGSMRVTVDYRKLNEVTKKDRYPLSRCDELIDSMGLERPKYFSTLDLVQGFHQMRIADESVEKTAFSCQEGHFEYLRLPMGLTNSPASFQRLQNEILKGTDPKKVKVYLDDVAIATNTFEDHLLQLSIVFARFRRAGLRVKLQKCRFLKDKPVYLGFEISKDGIRPNADRILDVLAFKPPTTVKMVRQFVGLCSFYRRFVPNFAKIARPLTNLTKKDESWHWGDEQAKAFQQLKDLLTCDDVLAYPQWGKPYYILCDASAQGLGAILHQRDDEGRYRPIAYASRATDKNEQKYGASELECLCLVWALQHFHYYIWGQEIFVESDHQPLTCLNSKQTLPPRLERWNSIIIPYAPKIIYRRGRENEPADALSRYEKLAGTATEAALDSIVRVIKNYPDPDVDLEKVDREVQERQRQLQLNDPFWFRIIQAKEAQREGEKRTAVFGRMAERYRLLNGVLYFVGNDVESTPRLCVPQVERRAMIERYHEQRGVGAHLGAEKVFMAIAAGHFWPRMKLHVEQYCRECRVCLEQRGGAPRHRPPLAPIKAEAQPFAQVQVDVMNLPKTTRGNKKVLGIVDSFTGYLIYVPMKNEEATTVARKLHKHLFMRFAAPRRLLSDNGTNFHSNVINELNKRYGVEHHFTTTFTPHSNGKTEKANSTMRQMLAKMTQDHPEDWDELIPDVMWAHNTTPVPTTGFSPHFLVFGSNPAVVSDSVFDWPTLGERLNYDDFISQLERRRAEAIKIADVNRSATQEKQKVRYDKKATVTAIKLGEKVMVYRPNLKTDKLKPKYDGPYEVVWLSDSVARLRRLVDNVVETHNLDKLSRCPENTQLTNKHQPNKPRKYQRGKRERKGKEPTWPIGNPAKVKAVGRADGKLHFSSDISTGGENDDSTDRENHPSAGIQAPIVATEQELEDFFELAFWVETATRRTHQASDSSLGLVKQEFTEGNPLTETKKDANLADFREDLLQTERTTHDASIDNSSQDNDGEKILMLREESDCYDSLRCMFCDEFICLCDDFALNQWNSGNSEQPSVLMLSGMAEDSKKMDEDEGDVLTGWTAADEEAARMDFESMSEARIDNILGPDPTASASHRPDVVMREGDEYLGDLGEGGSDDEEETTLLLPITLEEVESVRDRMVTTTRDVELEDNPRIAPSWKNLRDWAIEDAVHWQAPEEIEYWNRVFQVRSRGQRGSLLRKEAKRRRNQRVLQRRRAAIDAGLPDPELVRVQQSLGVVKPREVEMKVQSSQRATEKCDLERVPLKPKVDTVAKFAGEPLDMGPATEEELRIRSEIMNELDRLEQEVNLHQIPELMRTEVNLTPSSTHAHQAPFELMDRGFIPVQQSEEQIERTATYFPTPEQDAYLSPKMRTGIVGTGATMVTKDDAGRTKVGNRKQPLCASSYPLLIGANEEQLQGALDEVFNKHMPPDEPSLRRYARKPVDNAVLFFSGEMAKMDGAKALQLKLNEPTGTIMPANAIVVQELPASGPLSGPSTLSESLAKQSPGYLQRLAEQLQETTLDDVVATMPRVVRIDQADFDAITRYQQNAEQERPTSTQRFYTADTPADVAAAAVNPVKTARAVSAAAKWTENDSLDLQKLHAAEREGQLRAKESYNCLKKIADENVGVAVRMEDEVEFEDVVGRVPGGGLTGNILAALDDDANEVQLLSDLDEDSDAEAATETERQVGDVLGQLAVARNAHRRRIGSLSSKVRQLTEPGQHPSESELFRNANLLYQAYNSDCDREGNKLSAAEITLRSNEQWARNEACGYTIVERHDAETGAPVWVETVQRGTLADVYKNFPDAEVERRNLLAEMMATDLAMRQYNKDTDLFNCDEYRNKYFELVSSDRFVSPMTKSVFHNNMYMPKSVLYDNPPVIADRAWQLMADRADRRCTQFRKRAKKTMGTDEVEETMWASCAYSYDQAGSIIRSHFLQGYRIEPVMRYVHSPAELEPMLEWLQRQPNLDGIVSDQEVCFLGWDLENGAGTVPWYQWRPNLKRIYNVNPVVQDKCGPFPVLLTLSNCWGLTLVIDLRFTRGTPREKDETVCTPMPQQIRLLLEKKNVFFVCFDFNAEQIAWENAWGMKLPRKQFIDLQTEAEVQLRTCGIDIIPTQGRLSLGRAIYAFTGDFEMALEKAGFLKQYNPKNFDNPSKKYLKMPEAIAGSNCDLRYAAKDSIFTLFLMFRVALVDFYTQRNYRQEHRPRRPTKRNPTPKQPPPKTAYHQLVDWIKEIGNVEPQKLYKRLGETSFTKGKELPQAVIQVMKDIARRLARDLTLIEQRRDQANSAMKIQLPYLTKMSIDSGEGTPGRLPPRNATDVASITMKETGALTPREWLSKYGIIPVPSRHEWAQVAMSNALQVAIRYVDTWMFVNDDTHQGAAMQGALAMWEEFDSRWATRYSDGITETALEKQLEFEHAAMALKMHTPVWVKTLLMKATTDAVRMLGALPSAIPPNTRIISSMHTAMRRKIKDMERLRVIQEVKQRKSRLSVRYATTTGQTTRRQSLMSSKASQKMAEVQRGDIRGIRRSSVEQQRGRHEKAVDRLATAAEDRLVASRHRAPLRGSSHAQASDVPRKSCAGDGGRGSRSSSAASASSREQRQRTVQFGHQRIGGERHQVLPDTDDEDGRQRKQYPTTPYHQQQVTPMTSTTVKQRLAPMSGSQEEVFSSTAAIAGTSAQAELTDPGTRTTSPIKDFVPLFVKGAKLSPQEASDSRLHQLLTVGTDMWPALKGNAGERWDQLYGNEVSAARKILDFKGREFLMNEESRKIIMETVDERRGLHSAGRRMKETEADRRRKMPPPMAYAAGESRTGADNPSYAEGKPPTSVRGRSTSSGSSRSASVSRRNPMERVIDRRTVRDADVVREPSFRGRIITRKDPGVALEAHPHRKSRYGLAHDYHVHPVSGLHDLALKRLTELDLLERKVRAEMTECADRSDWTNHGRLEEHLNHVAVRKTLCMDVAHEWDPASGQKGEIYRDAARPGYYATMCETTGVHLQHELLPRVYEWEYTDDWKEMVKLGQLRNLDGLHLLPEPWSTDKPEPEREVEAEKTSTSQ